MKQPFYHRIDGVLFTATREVSEQEVVNALKQIKGVVKESVEVEPNGYQNRSPATRWTYEPST